MKKLISVLLSASLILGLASCGNAKNTKRTRDRDEEDPTTAAAYKVEKGDETILTTGTVPATFSPDFTFSTTDRDGNTYDERIFSSGMLTMVNFWEPWCGPCVNEMPDIEKLYENYKDMGLQVVGVYSETSMENDVTQILKDYNKMVEDAGEEDKSIVYTDIVGALMKSVTKIINTISYVLIAFVAISLVVSSIMIGVITYISVLERRKEIGILRAMGASKHNVAQVFNAPFVAVF